MKPRTVAFAIVLLTGLASTQAVAAEKKYGPGVSDTEIKLGQTMPYSGRSQPSVLTAERRSRFIR